MLWYLLYDLAQEGDVETVVVRGVKVPPELGAGQGTVPELVDEGSHPLLLSLEPQVIPVPSLHQLHHHDVIKRWAWLLEWGGAHHKQLWLVKWMCIVVEHLQLPSQFLGEDLKNQHYIIITSPRGE